MSIHKQFLIPEFYIMKIPVCDECNIQLEDTNVMLPSYPPKYVYKCKQCGKEYNYTETELRGEWKWRTI